MTSNELNEEKFYRAAKHAILQHEVTYKHAPTQLIVSALGEIPTWMPRYFLGTEIIYYNTTTYVLVKPGLQAWHPGMYYGVNHPTIFPFEDISIKPRVCECGAEKTKQPKHSNWCALHVN